MILEDETFEAFGYYPSKLTHGSGKSILAACNNCGNVRITSKHTYCSLCRSCAMNGKKNALEYKHTDDAKAKISVASKGKNNPNFNKHPTKETRILMRKAHEGKTYTEETKALMSAAKKGEKNHRYNGGKKVSNARQHAKRKRQLGYVLLMPLAEGEEGHHVTNEYVMGIPADIHKKFAGGGRKKHRTKVLQWLKANDKRKYKMVLCVLAKEPL